MPRSEFRHRGCDTVSPPLVAALVIWFSLAGFTGTSNAQTGSIRGTVVDKDGAPLADVNLILPDRRLGTSTNAQGAYSLTKVPVGVWTMQAVRAGKKRAIRTVYVDANKATIENFRLLDDTYKLPVVTVHTDRKTEIRKTDSATRQHVTPEDLLKLPITNYMETIAMKAGVTSQGGEVHFRGGRVDEVLTIVNGIPARNALSSEGIDLGLLAIGGIEQVLGGMDAQYGNALSGVIALTTREGGDKFGGEVRYFTDRYGEQDKSFNDFERLSVGVGGPFLFPKTNYYVSFEGTFSDTYLRNTASHKEHRFLDFIRIGNKQSNATNFSSKLTWKVTPNQKLNLELIRNATLSSRFHNRWNRKGFVQVISDSTAPSDGTITRQYGSWAYYQVDSTYIPMNTAEHLPVRDEDYQQVALTWRHTMGRDTALTVYNIRASRQEWKSTEDVLDRQLWEYEQSPNNYYDPFNRIEGPYYVTNGDYPFFEHRRTSTYTVNGDLSRRMGRHSVMVGGDFNYNDLQYLLTQFPNVLDANGNYGATRDEFRNFNPEGSFFLQDRWQYEGMVLNAGLRYDSFSVGNKLGTEVLDPVKTQWSPRIGIAYPISDRDVMSFHYGRLFQVPDRLYVFQGRTISAEARGNPNLEPETTISYQIGVQHLFTNDVFLQCGVYYKDVFGLLTTVDQEIPGFAITVPTYVNGDYASSRGIEVTLIKNFSHGYSGEINYTYGNYSGTASDPNRALGSRGNLRDQFKPNAEVPLRWDQRHGLSGTLRLSNEKNWAASFVYQFGTGFPYTPEQRQQRRQDPTLINSRRLPSTSNLSLQAERFFRVWGQSVTFYLQGTNLLDAKNINELQPSLWPDNGVNSHSYTVYYTETARAGGAFLIADQDGDGQDDWLPVNDPRVFQPGRVIRLGLGVQF